VAEVFYDKLLKKKERVFEKGSFLNQVLVEAGFAKIVG
jgi:hypothetical protein